MLISSLHPSSLKSERQLDFSQPIVLALGCSFTLPKLKKQKPSGLYSGNSKEVQAMWITEGSWFITYPRFEAC